ncbi:MAG: DUF4838 domain-containing protein [Clostridia bacterium]|nr:DUF4838 domain-containing protein [Clostridia bacterium]
MKRFISLLLVVLTLLAAVPMAVSADEAAPIITETGMPFKDVKENHWFYDAVKYTYEKGIFSANNADGDLFGPNVTMTRGMFVTVLFRLSGADQTAYTGKTVFTDVAENQWYAKAVEWANKEGYVAGMTETAFAPNGKITRAQMARILSLYAAKQDNYDLADVRTTAFDKFADAAKVQDWAKEGITWMSTTGLINGMGTENGGPVLNPNGNATRAQAAQILMSYSELRYGKETAIGEVYIGENNLKDYTIVYGETGLKNIEDDSWDAAQCATELKNYIAKAVGIDLPVKADTEPREDEANDKEILIGRTNREANGIVNIDRSSFDGDSLLIEVQGNYLILASSEEYSGTAYAVLEFCEEFLGYNFLGIIETIDAKNVVEIPWDYSYTYSPQVHYRMNHTRDYKVQPDIVIRDDINNYTFANIVHTLPGLAADPEVYRTDWSYHVSQYLSPDPCLTRPDHVQNVIDNVITYLSEKPKNNLMWVTQADGEAGCNGRNAEDIANGCTCAQFYREHGRYSNYLLLLDKVGKAIKKEAETNPEHAYFADYQIVGLAYKYTWVKLKNTESWDKISDNVIICICTDNACSAHAITDPNCKNNTNSNVKFLEVYESYKAVCDNLFVWDYIGGDVYSDSPFPIIHQMYENYKLFHEEGVWGIYTLGDCSRNASFPELKTYLTSKLMWENDMTEAEYWGYVESFLESFYGDGWSYIREYIDVTHELGAENEWHIWTNNRWDAIITYEQYTENLDNLVYLWEKAEELACTDEQKLNVRRSATQIKYIEVCVAYETYRRSGSDADLEAFKVINQAYGDYLATLDSKYYKLPSNWTIDLDPNVWRNDAK